MVLRGVRLAVDQLMVNERGSYRRGSVGVGWRGYLHNSCNYNNRHDLVVVVTKVRNHPGGDQNELHTQ